MIKAVIFDMDGVISDTQKLAGEVESMALSGYGIHISPKKIIKKYSGVKDITQFTEIFNSAGVSINVEKFINEKNKTLIKKIQDYNIEIPGVINFINLINKNGYLLALASASPHKFVKAVLTKLNLMNKFEAIITAEDVKLGKPNPELFMLAAKKINVNPANCLVIEDAENGVKAAKTAGMKCIAITTTHNREDLQKADLIIDSFEEIDMSLLPS